jgi:hypothetical protein
VFTKSIAVALRSDFMNFVSDTRELDKKFDTIKSSDVRNLVRRYKMKFTSKKHYFVIFALAAMTLNSCTSKDSEDDASLQAEEPVAGSADEAEVTSPPAADPSQAAEAKPAASVAAETATHSATAAETAPSQVAVRRVMYVKFDGVAMREKPDSKSKKIGKLNRGDHVLVSIEGDWACTEAGKYIALKGLSERGVGPGKKEATWSGGGKPSEAPAATPDSSSVSAPTVSKQSEPARKLPKKIKSSSKAKAVGPSVPSSAPTVPSSAPTGEASSPASVEDGAK